MHAVATLFDAYVVVVIHAHESIYCFGNPSGAIITLYQRLKDTHFDALVPVSTVIPEGVLMYGCIVVYGSVWWVWLVWWCMVMYECVWWCMVVYGVWWCTVVWAVWLPLTAEHLFSQVPRAQAQDAFRPSRRFDWKRLAEM